MKLHKTANRGTEIKISDVGEQNWAGDSFRKLQKDRLEKIGKNITMHLGRGIKTTSLDKLSDPRPRPSTEGRTRITNRGTSWRKSTNKGN